MRQTVVSVDILEKIRLQAVNFARGFLPVSIIIEPPRDKINKMTFTTSEDSDQPDQSIRCPHEETFGSSATH